MYHLEYEVWDLTNNVVVNTGALTYFQIREYKLTLQAGITYQIRLTLYGENSLSDYSINYKTGSTFSNVEMPYYGARVKQVITSTPGAAPITKHFSYKAFTVNDCGLSFADYTSVHFWAEDSYLYSYPFTVKKLSTCVPGVSIYSDFTCHRFTSNSQYNPNIFQGSFIAYSFVTEFVDDNKTSFIASEYGVGSDAAADLLIGEEPPYRPYSNLGWQGGLEQNRYYGSFASNNYAIAKAQHWVYSTNNASTLYFHNYVYHRKYVADIEYSGIYSQENYVAWAIVHYVSASQWYKLDTVKETLYASSGNCASIVSENSFLYNSFDKMVATEVSLDSKGKTIEKISKRPKAMVVEGNDPIGVYQQMINKFQIDPVVEQVTLKDNNQMLLSRTNYKDFSGLYLPETVEIKNLGNAAETRVKFHDYDTKGNLLNFSDNGGMHAAYLWGYNAAFAIAKIANASLSDVAYTSFETYEQKGNWVFYNNSFQTTSGQPNQLVAGTLSGGRAYNLLYASNGIVKDGLDVSKVYKLSFWYKGAEPVISVTTVISKKILREKDGWHLLELVFTSSAQVSLPQSSVDSYVDELRLCPAAAEMVTYVYDPLVGITGQFDAGNKAAYYEYDEVNRLKLIRDQDGNILKRICYNYAGQPDACSSAIYARLTLTNQHSVTGGTILASYTTTYADVVVSFYTDAAGTLPVSVANFPISILSATTFASSPTPLQSTSSYTCNGSSYTLPNQEIRFQTSRTTALLQPYTVVYTLVAPVGYIVIN
jgi:hypothetical protein